MEIDVIMPVCGQRKFTEQILRQITENTVKPRAIYLIDNANELSDLVQIFARHLKIVYLPQEQNIGVNCSWNIGIQMSKSPILSILNNDLDISKYFFEYIKYAFQLDEKAGIVCPTTIEEPLKGREIKPPKPKFVLTTPDRKRREGWAFSIKRDLAMKAWPIPKWLFTFFGDDYLFQAVRRLGFKVLWINNNLIHHYKNQTLKHVEIPYSEKEERARWNGV